MDLYDAYISSPEWAAKRAQRLEIDGHKCRTCGHTGDVWSLQVHHVSYVRLGGEDVNEDLITLCSICHDAITNVIRSRRYEGRIIEVKAIETTITTRTEIHYGMASTEVPTIFIGSAVDAQRADGKPNQQVCKVDEADFVKARQDGR